MSLAPAIVEAAAEDIPRSTGIKVLNWLDKDNSR
jgi:hypothetical protein